MTQKTYGLQSAVSGSLQPMPVETGADPDMFTKAGRYYFHMEESTYYWHNILVNIETGDLLSLTIDDGMFGGEYVMTLEDWYSKTAYPYFE